MQYNENLYNGASYNYTLLNAICLETITSSDTVAKMPMIVKIDSQSSVDALSDGVSMAALLDSVGFYLRARYANPYGAFSYNEAMYNLIEDDDEILLQAMKVLTDSIDSTDSVDHAWDAFITRIDTITSADATITFIMEPVINEFLFLSEFMRVEITNKALNETLRVADWVSIERRPVNQEWGD